MWVTCWLLLLLLLLQAAARANVLGPGSLNVDFEYLFITGLCYLCSFKRALYYNTSLCLPISAVLLIPPRHPSLHPFELCHSMALLCMGPGYWFFLCVSEA